MCFVRVTEQTAMTWLKIIGLLNFVNELECVYFAVSSESLNSIQAVLLCKGHC